MKAIDIKTKLSTLWIVVMMNMIFADIFTVFVELVNENTLTAIPGDVKVIMAIAAIVTNIPILMIYFSRVLPYKWNRLSNIIAGMFKFGQEPYFDLGVVQREELDKAPEIKF